MPDIISSGSPALDETLEVGGFPMQGIVEFAGEQGSGKTTVALHSIAEAQKLGKICAYIDVARQYSVEYASAIGIDTKALLVSQVDDDPKALALAEMLVRTSAVELVVLELDSHAHRHLPPDRIANQLASVAIALGALVFVTYKIPADLSPGDLNVRMGYTFRRFANVSLRGEHLFYSGEDGPITTGARITVTKNRYGAKEHPTVELRFRSDQGYERPSCPA